MPAHKFHLGQPVELNPPRGVMRLVGSTWSLQSCQEKTACLNIMFGARASSTSARSARETELNAVVVEEKPPEAAPARARKWPSQIGPVKGKRS
jgi:hypothetical protein